VTAQERLHAWAASGYHAKNTATIECIVHTDRWLGISSPGLPMWQGWAKREPESGLVIAVEAGPRETPEEVCALLIERLAAAGVVVP
jgi:hypothetical protein